MDSSDKPANPFTIDEQWTDLISKITDQIQKITNEYINQDHPYLDTYQHMAQLGHDFQQIAMAYVSDPLKFVEAQANYLTDMWQLWSDAAQNIMDPEYKSGIKKADKRFKDEAWNDNNVFEFIKDGYLLFSDHMLSAIRDIETVDEKSAERLRFYTRQYVSALSPSNFGLTNPVVLSETFETRGLSMLKGLSQMLDDIEKGKGKLNITMTDESAFELGVNVATTQGEVIFQNEMLQLIQYYPTTETVYQRPVLVIPPWINKYYILDLRAKNSLVKWLADQGHSTFIISWVNPDAALKDVNFSNYVVNGAIAAIEAVQKATGEQQINAAGYCIGGTLLSLTMAHLKNLQRNDVAQATYFATLIDFREPGDIGVFIDDEQISALEQEAEAKGYFSGDNMALSFNLLRENDLVWSYYINNYLLGKDPIPFDLLYWNSDATNLPAKMHSYYLRNMYLENNLIKPGKIKIAGQGVDISSIDAPAYFISTEQDHIALWQATYLGAKLHSGKVRFVLGGSGHIAGIINPATSEKYGYRTNDELPATAEAWLAGSESHSGSWWQDWHNWLTAGCAQATRARKPGDGALPCLEPAPGSYVKKRIAH